MYFFTNKQYTGNSPSCSPNYQILTLCGHLTECVIYQRMQGEILMVTNKAGTHTLCTKYNKISSNYYKSKVHYNIEQT